MIALVLFTSALVPAIAMIVGGEVDDATELLTQIDCAIALDSIPDDQPMVLDHREQL
jgi:hypothetical protein